MTGLAEIAGANLEAEQQPGIFVSLLDQVVCLVVGVAVLDSSLLPDLDQPLLRVVRVLDDRSSGIRQPAQLSVGCVLHDRPVTMMVDPFMGQVPGLVGAPVDHAVAVLVLDQVPVEIELATLARFVASMPFPLPCRFGPILWPLLVKRR